MAVEGVISLGTGGRPACWFVTGFVLEDTIRRSWWLSLACFR